ncbi:hypothetical protein [uncultured Helicobacter sp.]|uniref:hypothetical protein n=1 Tax=uncultured Helicobacter sp. TaxID=175537 RepID=UPI002603840F|nr:hypothetical protein [uncultured Helicobacter sp.]
MKSFGFVNLESLTIPSSLLNDFCVIGIKKHCMQAITYTFDALISHKRIENLILIEPMINLNSLSPQFNTIISYGCKVYSYFTSEREINLQTYKIFTQFGLVIIAKI